MSESAEEKWRKRFERERAARKEAEHLLERKSLELYQANLELLKSTLLLEQRVEERTRELTEAKEKAEAANRCKSEFLANVSHELRTPLNAVLGFADLLLESVQDEFGMELIRAIKSSGSGLLVLINDMLDLSKIEAGKLTLEPDNVDLKRMLEDIHTLYSMQARRKGLAFELRLPALEKCVLIDEARLRQILVNLVGNAIKFTDSGRIGLELSIQEQGPRTLSLEFKVSDTGKGIMPDQLEQIFESFVQQAGQDSSKFGGTGLGLAISRRLVSLMGGAITVDSREGLGSTFTVRLPDVALTEDPGAPVPSTQDYCYQSILSGRTVLVVDDILLNRKLVMGFLRKLPVRVLQAENGREGVELAKESLPDVILLDMIMPEMDGLEAVRLLKQDPRTRDIPVIALTASAMREEQEECLASGCDDYLSKPVGKAVLLESLARALKPGALESSRPFGT